MGVNELGGCLEGNGTKNNHKMYLMVVEYSVILGGQEANTGYMQIYIVSYGGSTATMGMVGAVDSTSVEYEVHKDGRR